DEQYHSAPRKDLDHKASDHEPEREPDPGPGERHALPEPDSNGRRDGRDDGPVVREERALKGPRQRTREEQRGERAGQAGEPGGERAAEEAQQQDAAAAEPVAEEPRRNLHERVGVEER